MSKKQRYPVEPGRHLGALKRLFDVLNVEGIRYCVWKGNHHLGQSLMGITDLDLLVHPEDRHTLHKLFSQNLIKRFCTSPHKFNPDIENFLGLDLERGELFHLHTYYKLILDDQDDNKYYIVPLEDDILKTDRLLFGVKVPKPEIELVILCLRVLLRNQTCDSSAKHSPNISDGIPSRAFEEIQWLKNQANSEEIERQLEIWKSILPTEAIHNFLTVIDQYPTQNHLLGQLNDDVQKYLVRYAPPQNIQTFKGQYQRALQIQKRRWRIGTIKKMFPQNGGLTIAFIGADGSGKSTVTQRIAEWLSWRINTRIVYMGKSNPSTLTQLLAATVRTIRYAHAGSTKVFGKTNSMTRLAGWFEKTAVDLRSLCEGRDKFQRYSSSQKQAASGTIILFDRYPLDFVQVAGHTLDGPRIASRSANNPGWLTRTLSQAEQSLYQKIEPPNHIINLIVSPEVSLARKPDHREGEIRTKIQAMDQVAHRDLHSTIICADQPLEEVLLQVKSTIWQWL